MEKFKGRPFMIVGVNSDDSREDVKEAIKENNITWPSFFDGGSTQGPIARAWKVRGWPTIYLIDHKGNIVGEYDRNDATIEKLVTEAEANK